MLRTALQELFDNAEVLYECRSCGSQLAGGEEACARCGSSEIASYEFEST